MGKPQASAALVRMSERPSARAFGGAVAGLVSGHVITTVLPAPALAPMRPVSSWRTTRRGPAGEGFGGSASGDGYPDHCCASADCCSGVGYSPYGSLGNCCGPGSGSVMTSFLPSL